MYDDPRGDAPPDKVAAAQLGALFTLALTDEPESAVTAASVLREVRAESERAAARWSFTDWLREGGWKWGGAVVAAAALVGAVVVLPPLTGGAGSDSGAAGAGAEMARAYDSADADAGGDTGSSDDTASDQAFSMADSDAQDQDDAAADGAAMPEMAEAAPSAQATAGSGDESAELPAEDDGVTAEPAGGSDEVAEEGPAADGSEKTAMPPLTAEQWDAAVASLPAGETGTARTLAGNPGGVAGNLLRLSGGGSIRIVVERTGGTETFVDAQHLRDNGFLVADDEAGGVRVTVAANPKAQSSVSQADLDRIATAVRGAS